MCISVSTSYWTQQTVRISVSSTSTATTDKVSWATDTEFLFRDNEPFEAQQFYMEHLFYHTKTFHSAGTVYSCGSYDSYK